MLYTSSHPSYTCRPSGCHGVLNGAYESCSAWVSCKSVHGTWWASLIAPHSATVCSILKTTENRALGKIIDPTWDSVYLSIWSATELSVGILCASLPPLRKQFDAFFQVILPSTAHGSASNPPNGISMWNVSKTIGSKSITRSRGLDGDNDSERRILPEDETRNGTTKTVVHDVVSESGDDVVEADQRCRNLGENKV